MCGFLGIFNTKSNDLSLSDVQKANHALRHRGPDDEGYLLANTDSGHVVPCGGEETVSNLNLALIKEVSQDGYNGALAFRRLSILDPSPAGHQPMCSTDRRFWIVFNGEIYNFLEIRNDLIKLGYTFKSDTDTEVLLTAYIHWEKEVLLRLIGMFAFCVFDTHERSLFLARDFFGIKPLYFSFWDQGFAFASEIKALLTLSQVSRDVEPTQTLSYLRYGQPHQFEKTFFTSVQQLPPSHYIQLSTQRLETFHPHRYWDIDRKDLSGLSFDEAAAEVQRLFCQNIRLHLRSDVPIGATLSGGIDSSAVVMSIRKVQESPLNLRTFSYIANNAELSEEAWIDLVGKEADAIIHKTQPNQEELIAQLERLIQIQDEPFGSTSIFAQNQVFRLVQKTGIKVTIDGQGADEIFGGYRAYLRIYLASLLRKGKLSDASQLFKHVARFPGIRSSELFSGTLGMLLPPGIQSLPRKLLGRNFIPNWLNEKWFLDRDVPVQAIEKGREPSSLNHQLYNSVTKNLPLLLRYEDRNSMAYSVESRVPFLTPEFVSFALSLPEEYIIGKDGRSKAVFRQSMRGIVPEAILDRTDKIGFATPEKKWLTLLRPWVKDILNGECAAKIPVLNLSQIKKEWQLILDGEKYFDFRVWRWLNLIRWTEYYQVQF